jgi:hypothetical protein
MHLFNYQTKQNQFLNQTKTNTMKQFRVLAATLLLLAGISVESFAQSPTIQKEVRLVNPTTGGSGYVGLKAAAGTATYTLTLPGTIPTANQILKIDAVTGSTATATWSDASSLVTSSAWSLTGNGSTNPATNYLGTSDAQGLSIRTAATERIAITSGGAITLAGATTVSNSLDVTGATSLASTLGVTGATTLSSTLDVVGNTTLGGTLGVTGATTLTGLLTANNGATISGTTSVTGVTGINTSGTAATTIGNTSANTAVTINTGSTGGLTLGGLQTGLATSDVLVLDGSNKVSKISMSTLNSGLYRAKGTESVSGLESKEITGITGLTTTDVINITLEGAGADMPIPSYYVVRDTGNTKFTVYFSAAFTGTFNYAVIK